MTHRATGKDDIGGSKDDIGGSLGGSNEIPEHRYPPRKPPETPGTKTDQPDRI